MKHEDLVREFREIRDYLQDKAQDIKARYGEIPVFENEIDGWHYKLLMQVCATVQEPQSFIPYIKVEVPDINFARSSYGIEI